MTDPRFEEWVAKAEEDYVVASSLDTERTPTAICFHCQQCVEKYLKAALVKHGVPTHKTHNLTVLNDLVAEHDPRFERFHHELGILNPYSVMGRYPGFDLAADDATRALEVGSRLRRQIRALLDLQARPDGEGERAGK